MSQVVSEAQRVAPVPFLIASPLCGIEVTDGNGAGEQLRWLDAEQECKREEAEEEEEEEEVRSPCLP